jgi:hypothetical protein
MPLLLAGGRVDRGGAGPRSEMRLGREAGDVPDVTEDPGGADWADAVELVQAVPVAVTASVSCRSLSVSLRSSRAMSASSSAASCRRVQGATSRGRTVARSALACAADRNRGAPPGISSGSSRCSRLTVRVRAPASSSRRSANSRSTTSSPSTVTSAGPACGLRPRRWSERRWRRSCGRARWRTPGTRADSFAGYVHHLLAVGDQPLGHVPADAVAAFRRPDPARPPPACGAA